MFSLPSLYIRRGYLTYFDDVTYIKFPINQIENMYVNDGMFVINEKYKCKSIVNPTNRLVFKADEEGFFKFLKYMKMIDINGVSVEE